jgi:hypothetical protein
MTDSILAERALRKRIGRDERPDAQNGTKRFDAERLARTGDFISSGERFFFGILLA